MNGLYEREVLEKINRQAHERLLREAAEARQARKAIAWLRLFKGKNGKQEEAYAKENADKPATSPAAGTLRPERSVKPAG